MKNKVLVLLLTLIISISLVACNKPEEVVEDTHYTIVVTQEELIPEITDEDLGIVRKEINELWHITGYSSWNDYNFLVLNSNDPEKNMNVTVQVENKDLFNSIYNARNNIYLNPSYSSITTNDIVYQEYASGIRSLGNAFYLYQDNLENTTFNSQDKDIDKDINEEISEDLEDTEDETISDSEETEIKDTENIEDTKDTETIQTEETENKEADSEEDKEIESTSETDETIETEDDSNTESDEYISETDDELQIAINEYISNISLNRLSKVEIYDLEGILLGDDLSPAKIDDYIVSLNIQPIPYEAKNGIIYLSDIEDNISYSTSAFLDDTGNYSLSVKNDKHYPAVLNIESENNTYQVPMFYEFMSTENSLGWTAGDYEWNISGTDENYTFKINYYNSDTDLIKNLDSEQVLRVSDYTVRKDSIPSKYLAVLNDTDNKIRLEANTYDDVVLEPGIGIGIHRSAYDFFIYTKPQKTSKDATDILIEQILSGQR